MRYLLTLLLFVGGFLHAQDSTNVIRIVDTLSQKDMQERKPVLLQSEVDSLVQVYTPPVVNKPEVVATVVNYPVLISIGLLILILLLGYLVYRVSRLNTGQNTSNETSPVVPEQLKGKAKSSIHSLEKKIAMMSLQLEKASGEKSELQQTVKKYNGVHAQFESLTAGINKAYKVRYYPGAGKGDGMSMASVFQTENSLGTFAYQQLVKPLLEILDDNKNHPARLSDDDRKQILNLLLSLSFLYIESLYLRVQELSIGGKMVERLSGIAAGNAPDAALLKTLDTEFGSRALVVKMALDKAGVTKLAYPVFDETNLSTK